MFLNHPFILLSLWHCVYYIATVIKHDPQLKPLPHFFPVNVSVNDNQSLFCENL